MPQDLYQWENGGGLVHHCPQCYKPLTTPQSVNRCLGDHVECCDNYHTQLFKKGTSSQCAPCRASDEERNKRHREIAEKLLEIKHIRTEHDQAPISTLTPRTLNAYEHLEIAAGDSPLSKKERKVAKKAKKVSKMAKGVTTADIEFVATVLRSERPVEIESIDEDLDVKQNIFFHKGTSSIRQVRKPFVTMDQKGAVEAAEYHPEPERITGLLQLLNVAPVTSTTTTQEKRAIAMLRKKIAEDLVQLQHEEEGKRKRKAGFWRWANKKAYKRLMANGRFWSDKEGDLLRAVVEEDGGTDSLATTDTDVTETDTDITTPSEGEESEHSMGLKKAPGTRIEINTPKAMEPDDGWTMVGNVSKTKFKKSAGKLTLVHNGGLDKLVQSPRPRSGISFPAGFQQWFGTL